MKEHKHKFKMALKSKNSIQLVADNQSLLFWLEDMREYCTICFKPKEDLVEVDRLKQ